MLIKKSLMVAAMLTLTSGAVLAEGRDAEIQFSLSATVPVDGFSVLKVGDWVVGEEVMEWNGTARTFKTAGSKRLLISSLPGKDVTAYIEPGTEQLAHANGNTIPVKVSIGGVALTNVATTAAVIVAAADASATGVSKGVTITTDAVVAGATTGKYMGAVTIVFDQKV